MLRVLFVTTEMDDFVRVGGLAAVSAALPRALRPWSDVRILLPGYRDVVEQFTHIQIVGHCPARADMPPCTLGRAATRDGLPVYVLFPIIFGISIVGAYGASGRMFDLGLLVGFGLLGYAMSKLKYPSAPLILGFVLGDAMERALRQSLMMSQGDVLSLVERPISAIMLSLALVILLIPLLGWLNRLRVRAITENG